MHEIANRRGDPARPAKTLVLILLTSAAAPAFPGGSGRYSLDPALDTAVALPGAAAFLAGELLTRRTPATADPFGWPDEGWTATYDPDLDRIGDVTSVAAVAALPLLLDALTPREVRTIAAMYAECAMWTMGLKNLLKAAVPRPRPYMLRADTPADLLGDDERMQSFPSGHTAFAFMTASFLATVYRPESGSPAAGILVGASAFGLAGATAVLRVASGTHYLGDVLAGALLGSAAGYLVQRLHERRSEGAWAFAARPDGFSISYAY